ncbi:MAG: ATP-binding cassette domain-containing protein, partial [Erysipelotrichaceae bacterium]|nr:ATP-binding cassette domain-containing protein [Erysipelotrichaceae bacterium]
DVTNLKEFERAGSIGRVFQDPLMGICSDLTIQENLSIAKRKGAKRTLRRGLTESERKEYAKLLEPLGLGLEDRLTAKVGLLSGGQRQALTLLMATLVKPELLLLDEHTAALDPKTARKVLDLTQQLVSENQLTTLMITHNMRDALAFGNRLILMSEGKSILDISGEEKKKATVKDLLDLFEKSNGEINDQMFLS